MGIVFMGTPDFAAAHLEALLEADLDVTAVYTQPDKPRGRGMHLSPSPVKEAALHAGLPVHQPANLRMPVEIARLRELAPDILAVVAYGKILPPEVLELPALGCVNIHGSLLPRHRGSAPIQWAILSGDRVTGVTSMYMDKDVDTGDMIYSRSVEIGDRETSGMLFDRLKVLGGALLVQTIRDIRAGTAPRIPQDPSKATYTTQLSKSCCPIDWNKSAFLVVRQIYGLQPWPVATAEIQGQSLRIFDGETTGRATAKPAGTLLSAGEAGLEFACGDGRTVLLTRVQPAGKKPMAAADWLRGHPVQVAP